MAASQHFYGRERELTELVEALGGAHSGRGALLLLGGEPGIGKTRLAAVFADVAAAQGARVTWGRAWEAGGAPAYWPWIEALRPFAAEVAATVADVDRDRLLPLGRLLPEVAPAAAPCADLADPAQEQFRLFEAVATFLGYVARRSPMVRSHRIFAHSGARRARYDKDTQAYFLPPENAAALADESSPAFVPGMFQVIQAVWKAVDPITERFRSGDGFSWGDHHPCLFEGTERFFRAGYRGNLVSSWLPALEGAVERLGRGAKVADVGCGIGASTILMAQAYPKSRFFVYDTHGASIELANERAAAAGVADRVTFEVGGAADFPGRDYDLVCHFDCLHDLEDPAGAARRVRQTLAEGGNWMIVEPFALDRCEDNHNPIGRVFYSASTMICVPHSLSRRGPALGAQAGEARLRRIVTEAGFSRLRRATPLRAIQVSTASRPCG